MTKEEALERLRYKCSRAECCSYQVAETLRRWILSAKLKGGEPHLCEGDISEIVSVLVAERFVDESRFANAFVRDKLKFNKWGRNKIVYKLKSLGISQYIVEEALRENYYASEDGSGDGGRQLSGKGVLEEVVEKKWKSLEKEESVQKRRAKVIRFALGRGFEYEEILKSLKVVEAGPL